MKNPTGTTLMESIESTTSISTVFYCYYTVRIREWN